MKRWPKKMMIGVLTVGYAGMIFGEPGEPETGANGFINQPEQTLLAQQLVQQAIGRNAQTLFTRLNLDIAEDEVMRLESFYRPELFAESRYTDIKRENSAADRLSSALRFDEDIYTEQRWETEVGVRMPMRTGADITLSLSQSERESSLISQLQEERDDGYVDAEYSGSLNLTIRQPLLRGINSRLVEWQIEQAELDQQITEQRFRQQVLRVASDALTNYWRLYRQHAFIRIQNEALENAEGIEREVGAQVNAGRQPPAARLEAEAQVLDRRAELTDIRQQLHGLQGEIKTLLNLDGDEYYLLSFVPGDRPRKSPHARPDDYEEYVKTLIDQWPGYQIAMTSIAVEKLNSRVAVEENRPQLDLNLGYSTSSLTGSSSDALNESFKTEYPTWFVGLEYRMPLGPNARRDADLRTAKSRELQADLDMRGIRSSLTNELRTRLQQIDSAHQAMDYAERNVDLYRQLYLAESRRFSAGQTRLRVLQEREDDRIQAERRYIDAVVRYQLAIVALQLAEGSLFEQYGINISSQLASAM